MIDHVHATAPAPARTVGLLALVGVVLGAVQGSVIVDAGGNWLELLFPVVAAHCWVSGLVLSARRPANGTGGLLLLLGLALFASQLTAFDVPVLIAAGLILQTTCLAVFLHVLIALPGGRLETREARRLVTVIYAVVLIGTVNTWLLPPGPESPFTLLRIVNDADLYEAYRWAASTAYGIVTLWSVAVLVRRRAALPPGQRRTIGPLYVYGIVAALALWAVPNVGRRLLGLNLEVSGILQGAAIAGLPLVLLIAMRRGGFAQARGVEGLVRALGPGTPSLAATQARLGAALGDPSARIGVWAGDGHRDAAGRPFEPGTDAGRAVVEVRRDEQRVGAIEYDVALGEDLTTVHAAADVIGLALERERLLARLQVSADQLWRSRERVVEAADRERRRIAQDLHDGLQARLVLLAIQARTLTVDDAQQVTHARTLHSEIDAAIDELRHLVQGVMPSALIERDLAAAIDDLVDRMPLPVDVVPFQRAPSLPSVVESTLYFVVAEAFSNAIKHAGATRLRVELHDTGDRVGVRVSDDGVGGAVTGRGGLGLRGLQDRVDALGGRLELRSPPGGGTHVTAEVPCEW